jgi:hypothetical protein
MSVQFQDTKSSFTETLLETARTLPPGTVTLRQLLEHVGEQGLLLFCMILMVPLLLPMGIPGVSTVFSVVIMLVAVGIILNRLPWLPNRIMERQFSSESLRQIMTQGAQLFGRIERFVKPRIPALTSTGAANRFNGFVLFVAGVLLIFPLPVIPFSNTLPAYGILFLAIGMLQRDGIFVLLGYLLVVASIVYFGVLAIAAVAGGASLLEWFRSVSRETPEAGFIWVDTLIKFLR